MDRPAPAPFGPKDEEVAHLLQELGLPRHAARALAYLARSGDARAVEIERATGLRQPEVSLAMLRLRDEGWVEQRTARGNGKGRPQHVYGLKVDFADVVDALEASKREEAARHVAAVGRIRSLTVARAAPAA